MGEGEDETEPVASLSPYQNSGKSAPDRGALGPAREVRRLLRDVSSLVKRETRPPVPGRFVCCHNTL